MRDVPPEAIVYLRAERGGKGQGQWISAREERRG